MPSRKTKNVKRYINVDRLTPFVVVFIDKPKNLIDLKVYVEYFNKNNYKLIASQT